MFVTNTKSGPSTILLQHRLPIQQDRIPDHRRADANGLLFQRAGLSEFWVGASMPIASSLFRGGGVTYAVRLALCLLSIDIQFGPVALKCRPSDFFIYDVP
jgi:hypothetical protein